MVDGTIDLFVGGSLSSFSLVKIVLYNLSWNSFANCAASFSGFTFSFLSSSQLQVMFVLQLPARIEETIINVSIRQNEKV